MTPAHLRNARFHAPLEDTRETWRRDAAVIALALVAAAGVVIGAAYLLGWRP